MPAPIRILCLTSWYPPHHRGGYELSCFDVLTRLEERGHHVEVLCGDERLPAVAEADTEHERNVHRRLQLYMRNGDLWTPSIRQRLRIERSNQRALAEVLESCRPDVVSVWHVGALSLGLLTTLIARDVPILYAISDEWPAYALKLDPWMRLFASHRYAGRLAARATGVPATLPDLDRGAACFISEVTRDQVRRWSPWGFPSSMIVYSGIDGRLFTAPAEGRRPWGWRLVYVGRLDPRKGIETLVRALLLLPQAQLLIDGRGEDAYRARLQSLVGELGLRKRVQFQASPRERLPEVYSTADACVFPSEWEEPFGLVPLEAMACGTPVVATGVAGSGEFLFDGQNCVTFDAADPASLAAAVRRLSEEDELRAGLVREGFQTARFFDSEHLADAFEATLVTAASSFPDGPLPDRHPPHLSPLGGEGG